MVQPLLRAFFHDCGFNVGRGFSGHVVSDSIGLEGGLEAGGGLLDEG